MVVNGIPSSLLFACSENSVRSPMAEALAKRLYGQAVYIDSVGVRASEVDSFAAAALDEHWRVRVKVRHPAHRHAVRHARSPLLEEASPARAQLGEALPLAVAQRLESHPWDSAGGPRGLAHLSSSR